MKIGSSQVAKIHLVSLVCFFGSEQRRIQNSVKPQRLIFSRKQLTKFRKLMYFTTLMFYYLREENIDRIEEECRKEIQAYMKCVERSPRTWQAMCQTEKENLNRCTTNK